MLQGIRYGLAVFALLWGVAAAASEPVAAPVVQPVGVATTEPMILTVTAQGKTMDSAIAALTQAIVNNNYTFVRQQAMDSRLVPYAQEVHSVRLVYFCNFTKMDRALRIDPRATQVLPCRVTLVETPTGVDLIAVNPAWVTQNMPALQAECQEMKRDYLAILEEAAL